MAKIFRLVKQVDSLGIDLQEGKLPGNIKGIFCDDGRNKLIALNACLQTQAEQNCVLAEELGHYYTSHGNLLISGRLDAITIRRQELRARRWAAKRLIPILDLIRAYKAGCRSADEIAEFLEVTEDFLKKSLEQYTAMYGQQKQYGRYTVYFDPLTIIERR